MQLTKILFLFALLLLAATSTTQATDDQIFSLGPFLNDRIRDGEAMLNRVKGMALGSSPQEYQCWDDTYEYLVADGCEEISHERRSRLAFVMAACHLSISGRNVPECPHEMSTSECVRGFGDDAVGFQTYNLFFTHADNVCMFLKSSRFATATQDAVNAMYRSILDAALALSGVQQAVESTAAEVGDSFARVEAAMLSHEESERLRHAKVESYASSMLLNQQRIRDLQNELQITGRDTLYMIRSESDSVHSLLAEASIRQEESLGIMKKVHEQQEQTEQCKYWGYIFYLYISLIYIYIFISTSRSSDVVVSFSYPTNPIVTLHLTFQCNHPEKP